MTPMVEVQGLYKQYGNHSVLKGCSFSVQPGEIFALLGANGAGKTTALACVEGLRRYDRGSIQVKGRMGIQLQCASLPEHLRVGEALQLFAKWNQRPVRACLVEELGLGELVKRPYRQLSTGQKRRLHLALAQVGDPDLLVLDEPTAGLDVQGRFALHQQIRRLKDQGKTILLSSHDMAEVESLCDRMAVLREGTIVFCGTTQELAACTGKRYHIYLKTNQRSERCQTNCIQETLSNLLETCRSRGERILDLQVNRGSLEEQFLQIAKEE